MTKQIRQTPEHLLKHGKALYLDIAEEYSIDDSAGLALLVTAAECLDRCKAAQKSIADRGEIVVDRYDQVKINPACILEKDSRNGFMAAIKALNLDLEPLKSVGRQAS